MIYPYVNERGWQFLMEAFDHFVHSFTRAQSRPPCFWEANDWLIQSFGLSISETDKVIKDSEHKLSENPPEADGRRGKVGHWTVASSPVLPVMEKHPSKLYLFTCPISHQRVLAQGPGPGTALRVVARVLKRSLGPEYAKHLECLGPIHQGSWQGNF